MTIIAAAATLAGAAADGDYVKSVEAWRAKHEADYTRDFVPLAGLFFLKEGEQTVGSGSSNAIRLPARAPARLGRFVSRNRVVRFEPASDAGAVSLNGKPVTSAVTLPPAPDNGTVNELRIGDLALWVHESGDRLAIRMRDPQSDLVKSFAGFKWFPIDPAYRVVATFTRDPKPRELKVPSLTGDEQRYTTEGTVEFTLAGQRVKMRPMTTRPNRFFFVFKDATSGKETYEAARFLYADLQSDGTAVLDFNQAYNPPCAFNPFTTCPLPLPENRLSIGIRAGERAYAQASRQQ
jgi:uncharacterized protein (DUF1684 family)